MPPTCVVKGCYNKPKRWSSVMFHTIASKNPARMKLWLVALNIDPNTPTEKLRKMFVCSDHFSRNDYYEKTEYSGRYRTKGNRLVLRETAIPSLGLTNTVDVGDMSNVQEDPTEVEASISGQYLGLAPNWARQSETSAVDVSPQSSSSMTSLPDAEVPSTSPSTSGSTSSIPAQTRGWGDRKLIVNESKLMELFQKCNVCGAPMSDLNKNISSSGSRFKVTWKCKNDHTGEWESCPNVRGVAENDLLAAAATLFTGASYPDIAEWAALLRLQLPQKTTFYNMQSSYLIPIIEEAYKKQENVVFATIARLISQGEGVQQVCGDEGE
ncbi:uncharacterized protein ACBR49_015851 [Aulostomus maculatus]